MGLGVFCRRNEDRAVDLVVTLVGFLVGGIIGMTGIGGGAFMTPFLLLYGVPPIVAVGTDLLYAAVTKMVAVAAFHTERVVDWRTVRLLAFGSVPATLLALGLVAYLGQDAESFDSLITRIISITLVLTSLVLLFRRRLASLHRYLEGLSDSSMPIATVLVGVLLGFLVTLSSVGAGALGTAALLILYPTLKARSLVGIDLAHAVPLTVIAGLGHMALGSVDFGLLGNLLLGSIPGILLGIKLSRKLPDRGLKNLLASILLLVGVGFVLKTL